MHTGHLIPVAANIPVDSAIGQACVIEQLVNLVVAQLAIAVEEGAALVYSQIGVRRIVPDVLQVLVVQYKQGVAA